MRAAALAVVAAFAGLLLYGVGHLPERGALDAPTNTPESAVGSLNAASYYVENAYADAKTPNMVTVALADYRSFDTLGETTVIVTAGFACALILRRRRT